MADLHRAEGDALHRALDRPDVDVLASRKESSTRKKTPETMSRTSVCVPKPIAIPTMPAPASSGPMFTPSPARPIITAMTAITIWTNVQRQEGAQSRRQGASLPDDGPREVRGERRDGDVDHSPGDAATQAPLGQGSDVKLPSPRQRLE
jgi:hypothetical protein